MAVGHLAIQRFRHKILDFLKQLMLSDLVECCVILLFVLIVMNGKTFDVLTGSLNANSPKFPFICRMMEHKNEKPILSSRIIKRYTKGE